MAFPVAPGKPQYSGNFIPELWLGKLVELFYPTTVFGEISNTDFIGNIKDQGDKVIIRTMAELNVKPYVKGQRIVSEHPDAPPIELLIDKGHYFSAIEDYVDKIQSDINLMDMWAKDATKKMQIAVDKDVLNGIVPDVSDLNEGAKAGRESNDINLGTVESPIALNSSNIIDFIINMGLVLSEANAPEENRWIILPDKACALVKRSDLRDASIAGDGTSIMRNGRIGMIDGLTIYKSQHLKRETGNKYHILAGHKMATTFAWQATRVENITSEQVFGNIIRGFHVYGYKVVKPEALSHGVVTVGGLYGAGGAQGNTQPSTI